MNILDIILIKYPDARGIAYKFTQPDGSPWNSHIDGLEWNNTDFPKPTQEDIEAWTSQYQLEYDTLEVLRKRQMEYPPKQELIVALWERIVEGKTTATDELQAKRQQVKNVLPKPVRN